jgi:hypothetical protein
MISDRALTRAHDLIQSAVEQGSHSSLPLSPSLSLSLCHRAVDSLVLSLSFSLSFALSFSLPHTHHAHTQQGQTWF